MPKCEHLFHFMGFPCGPAVKNLSAKAGDIGSIPGWGRPSRGGNGSSLHYSCLQKPIDRGVWRATVHSAAELDMTKHAGTHFTF